MKLSGKPGSFFVQAELFLPPLTEWIVALSRKEREELGRQKSG
jgi:hypothetical protein